MKNVLDSTYLLSLAALGGSGSVTALSLGCLLTAAGLCSADCLLSPRCLLSMDRLRSADCLLSGMLLGGDDVSSVGMEGVDLLVGRPR